MTTLSSTTGAWGWAGKTGSVYAHSPRKPSINLPNPYSDIGFMRWAELLREQWAAYNVPRPVSEGLWLDWATQLLALPPVVSAGVVDPDWRDWAVTLLQVPN